MILDAAPYSPRRASRFASRQLATDTRNATASRLFLPDTGVLINVCSTPVAVTVEVKTGITYNRDFSSSAAAILVYETPWINAALTPAEAVSTCPYEFDSWEEFFFYDPVHALPREVTGALSSESGPNPDSNVIQKSKEFDFSRLDAFAESIQKLTPLSRSADLIELAKRAVAASTESKEENINTWAARLVSDVKGATD